VKFQISLASYLIGLGVQYEKEERDLATIDSSILLDDSFFQRDGARQDKTKVWETLAFSLSVLDQSQKIGAPIRGQHNTNQPRQHRTTPHKTIQQRQHKKTTHTKQSTTKQGKTKQPQDKTYTRQDKIR
jgi:hypothetical protein